MSRLPIPYNAPAACKGCWARIAGAKLTVRSTVRVDSIRFLADAQATNPGRKNVASS
jgi:hypothetical protein